MVKVPKTLAIVNLVNPVNPVCLYPQEIQYNVLQFMYLFVCFQCGESLIR